MESGIGYSVFGGEGTMHYTTAGELCSDAVMMPDNFQEAGGKFQGTTAGLKENKLCKKKGECYVSGTTAQCGSFSITNLAIKDWAKDDTETHRNFCSSVRQAGLNMGMEADEIEGHLSGVDCGHNNHHHKHHQKHHDHNPSRYCSRYTNAEDFRGCAKQVIDNVEMDLHKEWSAFLERN